MVGIPYDWCLRHRRAARCDVRPGEPLPRDARRLVGVTPGGQLEARGFGRRALPATAALPVHLLVRRRGRTVPAGPRRPAATLRLLPLHAGAAVGRAAGDGRPARWRSGCSPRPTGATSSSSPGARCGRARRYALRVTARVERAAFAQTLRLRTAAARRGPARLAAFELTRLAVPQPAFLASVQPDRLRPDRAPRRARGERPRPTPAR